MVSSAASAQNITLKQNTGSLVVHGKLLKFDGSFYMVESEEFGRFAGAYGAALLAREKKDKRR